MYHQTRTPPQPHHRHHKFATSTTKQLLPSPNPPTNQNVVTASLQNHMDNYADISGNILVGVDAVDWYHNNPTPHGCWEHPFGPPLLPHKISKCVIRHHQDGDDFPFVDVSGGSIFGQKIVEVAEFWVSSEEPGDVEGRGG
ncbi:unnamed protein product [Fraxinus pennsylvanica]|uniref:Uncharacterized protein n=1 Tax=Fraxinus pennsylvanica TaxID=56036 RepID=A0AAD2A7S9_9LAMI|nr:unnamed protein product [Fraxinus pennsylvanica]